MLFCAEWNVAALRALRLHEITAPVTVEQPGGPIELLEHAMWRPLRQGATWPDGPVRVRGLPF